MHYRKPLISLLVMNFGLRVSDEEKAAAIKRKRDAEALAKLILDIYLEKKRKENEIDDN